MDSIESDILQSDYDGLGTREARRQLAKDRYEASKEAQELRALAQAAVLKKEAEEDDQRRAQKTAQTSEKTARQRFIEAELREVSKVRDRRHDGVWQPRLSAAETELYERNLELAQVCVEVTTHAALLLKLQFPESYPEVMVGVAAAQRVAAQGALFLEARSRYLDAELVEKLKRAGEQEAARHLGERQVLPVVERTRRILTGNRLAPAYADLKQLRQYFATRQDSDVTSVKERSGVVGVALRRGAYFLDVEFSIPRPYPAKAAAVTSHKSNLPNETLSLFLAAAGERAMRLAELPAAAEEVVVAAREGAGSGVAAKSERLSQCQSLTTRRKVDALAADAEAVRQRAAERRQALESAFLRRPSLFPTVEFLHDDCLRPLASGSCRICQKSLLPSDPGLLSTVTRSFLPLRLYCGHMYHFKCVETYVSEPPFGKTCLHCGAKMRHSRLMTDEKILEQRWTHEQARKREIADVADFMSL